MSDCNLHRVIKKSRKDHQCEHCWLKIPKGSSYDLDTGIFDNDPYTSKQHTECRKAFIEYNKDSSNCEWFPLDYDDNFKEHQEKIKKLYGLETF
tara:strand:+ start:19989 stop:20270 length:282 start_codon:yes stop_codon:yes gene_type:complete